MAQVIDWTSAESHLVLNPLRKEAAHLRIAALPSLPGHIWLASSGSAAALGEVKLVALAKEAFLVSAAAVNNHLQAQEHDRWIVSLPNYHVGGLSIYARSYLSGSALSRWTGMSSRWDPKQFHRYLCDSGGTLVSLVPTQLWGLIEQEVPAPQTLRAVVIGGGNLSDDLYQRGRELGWPLLPSYGMTECCSQVATASLHSLRSQGNPRLRILPHVETRVGEERRLSLRSRSLLTGVAIVKAEKVDFRDPKEAGWYETQDLAELDGNYLRFLGRVDDLVKINGEIVSRPALQIALQQVVAGFSAQVDACVVFLPDPRKGYRVTLAIAGADDPRSIVDAFNSHVLPHERARDSYCLEKIPRTELGKVKFMELAEMITQLQT